MDYWLFQQINGSAGKSICLDSVGIFFANYFQYVLGGCLLLFLLVKNKKAKRKNLWIVGLAFLAALVSRYIFTSVLRFIFERPRPFIAHQVTQLIFVAANNPSFPSGHAAFFFALSTVVYMYNKNWGWWFFVGSFLISLARVFVGVHYPSDILAGALIGILAGWGSWRVYQFYQNKKAP
jgi:undecaprenyl-diphosphatase